MYNQEDYDVDKKIENALNPSLDLSEGLDELEIRPLKKTKTKNKFNFKPVLVFLILFILFCRNDKNVNFQLSNFVIKSERLLNIDLDLFKSLFSIDHKVDSNTFSTYIKQNNMKLVRAYINWGVDLEARDLNGRTALINAIDSNNIEITKLLLEVGASMYSQDLKEVYPSYYARNKPEIMQVLIRNGLDKSLIKENINIDKLDVDSKEKKLKEKADLKLNSKVVVEGNNLTLQTDDQESLSVLDTGSEELELLKGSFSKSQVDNKSEKKELYEEKQRVKLTGVKVSRRPKGVFVKTDRTTLKTVVVGIRNFGNYKATGVSAELFVPGYQESLELIGPSELEPYEQVEFSVKPDLVIFVEGKMKAKVTCDNCYK